MTMTKCGSDRVKHSSCQEELNPHNSRKAAASVFLLALARVRTDLCVSHDGSVGHATKNAGNEHST